MKNKNHIRSLCECGVFIAAAIALSFAELDLWLQGGSISLTMIPIVIMAVRWGPVWGVVTGLVFGTLKCLIGGHMEWGFISVMLDYTLAYGAVGLVAWVGMRVLKKNDIDPTAPGEAAPPPAAKEARP